MSTNLAGLEYEGSNLSFLFFIRSEGACCALQKQNLNLYDID